MGIPGSPELQHIDMEFGFLSCPSALNHEIIEMSSLIPTAMHLLLKLVMELGDRRKHPLRY